MISHVLMENAYLMVPASVTKDGLDSDVMKKRVRYNMKNLFAKNDLTVTY